MKVLLIRADEPRHRALARRLHDFGLLQGDFIEKVAPAGSRAGLSPLEKLHFDARHQFELDYFGAAGFDQMANSSKNIPTSGINSPEFHRELDLIEFDVAVTFGVSILGLETIQRLKNRILGVHLGLSPYYRGAGTNFFPFVNKELGAIGYTLMHLDAGIDTGAIVHQGRAPIVLGDSIHSIGNRNIENLIRDICRLLSSDFDFKPALKTDNSVGKFYRKTDFTELALRTAMNNLNSGLVESFLEHQKAQLSKFPLLNVNSIE